MCDGDSNRCCISMNSGELQWSFLYRNRRDRNAFLRLFDSRKE